MFIEICLQDVQVSKIFPLIHLQYIYTIHSYNIPVINDYGYVPLVVNTFRSFSHSWFITVYRRMSLVEQELLNLLTHLNSPLVFSEIRVTQFLVLCVCFVDRCLSFCPFSFGHYVVCPSNYGFWLTHWFLQTLLIELCQGSYFQLTNQKTSLPNIEVLCTENY